jgi:AraC-like DNA-binding protein/tetratricopeptide (TPR) repeat protein
VAWLGRSSNKEKVEMRKAVEEDVLGFPEEDRELARLLIRAARDEIHRDYEKAHSHYKAFLLHIENELTDPMLNVTAARSAAGLTGTSIYATEFSRIVGMNPGSYIEHHRMELARRLLQHTHANGRRPGAPRRGVTCIAFAVGYSNSNHFSERYEKFAGHRPTSEPKSDVKDTILLLEQLRRETEAKRQRKPIHRSLGLPAGLGSSIRGEGVSALWEEIRDLDRKQALDYIQRNIGDLDTHHFDYLLEKSKLEGRRSRERGEEIALIALDCLRAIELRKGRDLLDEKVLGHAILANARGLRLDFVGAQEAFQFIDMIREDKLRPDVLLHVNILRAYLLWSWKRDVKSSVEMVESLLPEVRGSASSEFLALTLGLAGQIYEASGHLDRALSMYEEAVEASRFIYDSHIIFCANYNLSYMYASVSDGKKASEIFKKVQELQQAGVLTSSPIHVTLLEARIHRLNGDLRRAEAAFLEAREGFTGLGLGNYVAVSAIELALLYLDLAEPGRAFSMAITAIDCISRYSDHKEAMTALAILQEASRAAIINEAMLRQALCHLEVVSKGGPSSPISAQ